MSARRSTSASGAVEKQSTNVYTVLLIIALFALITACVLLYQELAPYGEFMKWWDTSSAVSWTQPMESPQTASVIRLV